MPKRTSSVRDLEKGVEGLARAPVFDGALLSQWKLEQGHIVRQVTQPSEDRILQFNADVRNDPGVLRDLDFAGVELHIPELHYLRLVAKYPELNHQDAEICTIAWRKFLGTSEADPYRVRYRSKRRG